jgi:endonuclease-3 related protein
MALYEALLAHFGPQSWWPARTRFEVIVGAILTQNTNWQNVEKAIANLRRARLLVPERLRRLDRAALAERIRPAGYFNVKARRLGAFLDWLFCEYGGSLRRMAAAPTDALRRQLLAVNGIGRETADSILLYALERPVFVIDVYTRRVLRRHGLAGGDEDYDALRALFESQLPRRVSLYNEYHALLVMAGKHHCGTRARCDGCPLAFHRHMEED